MEIEVFVNTETHEVISSDVYRDKMNEYFRKCIETNFFEVFLKEHYNIMEVYEMDEDQKEEAYDDFLFELYENFSEDSDWIATKLEI